VAEAAVVLAQRAAAATVEAEAVVVPAAADYVYDVRRYWRAAGGALESDKPEYHSERLVSTFTYP
jgi:hypothetical protein